MISETRMYWRDNHINRTRVTKSAKEESRLRLIEKYRTEITDDLDTAIDNIHDLEAHLI